MAGSAGTFGCRPIPDVDRDPSPFPLIESQHAEPASGRMADKDRDPDVNRMQRSRSLDHVTDTKWHHDLRNDRDVERALRISRSLQSAGVCQRDGDEETRQTQDVKELDANPHYDWIVHSEYRQQLSRDKEEQRTDDRRAAETNSSGYVHGRRGAVGFAGTKILTSYRRRRAHQSDRRPRDE